MSRRQVASYLADGLSSDRSHRLLQVAAWLRTRPRSEADLLVRDVESILATRGYVTGQVTTALPTDDATQKKLAQFVKTTTAAREVELTFDTDPSLVGGVKVTLPDSELDTSVRSKLQSFVTEMSQ